MRKIKVHKWIAKDAAGKDSEESTILLFELMLKGQNPREIPRGLDKVRLYSNLKKALEKAKKTGIIELNENEYKFLYNLVEKEAPAIWGLNLNIAEALETFANAQPIEEKNSK